MLEPPNPICGIDEDEATYRVGKPIYGRRFRFLTIEVPAGYPEDRAQKYIDLARYHVGSRGTLEVRYVDA